MASYRKLLQYSSFHFQINSRICLPAYNKVSWVLYNLNIIPIWSNWCNWRMFMKSIYVDRTLIQRVFLAREIDLINVCYSVYCCYAPYNVHQVVHKNKISIDKIYIKFDPCKIFLCIINNVQFSTFLWITAGRRLNLR